MTINIAMKKDVYMDRWSLGDVIPMPTLMPQGVQEDNYFIYYSYAKKPAKLCEFWFEVQVTVHSYAVSLISS